VPLLAGYFAWKFTVQDLAGVERDLWAMGFAPLAAGSLLDFTGSRDRRGAVPHAAAWRGLVVGLARPTCAWRSSRWSRCWWPCPSPACGPNHQPLRMVRWPLALGALRLRDRRGDVGSGGRAAAAPGVVRYRARARDAGAAAARGGHRVVPAARANVARH
jgi:hypothetical protein